MHVDGRMLSSGCKIFIRDTVAVSSQASSCKKRHRISRALLSRMSAPGMGDLAGEVIEQLATSLQADDDRRPWLRADMKGNRGFMFIGIQHFDGRATWVLKHGKEQEHEMRFALTDWECALDIFFRASCAGGTTAVELYHKKTTLITGYVDVKKLNNLDRNVEVMINAVKQAI